MSGITVACSRVSSRLSFAGIINGFHTSAALNDSRWREKHGLPQNPNVCGPLTDYPDYSYKDGRPTPYGVRQIVRIEKQREYMKRINKLIAEVDHAVERHERMQTEQKNKREEILAKKLKPKGDALLHRESKDMGEENVQ